MGRHGTRRGAHRSEPENAGALRRFGGLIESTVPKRVEPPRLLNVLVISGVILGLLLFGYSTTQIYLQFGGNPGAGEGPGPEEVAPTQDAAPPEADRDEAASGEGDGPATQSGSSPTTVGYQILETTNSGFTALITVTNTSRSHLDAWELALAFESAEITGVSDADWEFIEDGILARQPGGQDGLDPGDSTTLTIDALGGAQSPVRCSLNGHVCEL